MPSILFVCRANQFRSPIAAACLRQIVERDFAAETWVIGSAGTWAEDGLAAPRMTLQAAERLGLSGLKKYVTRQVNAHLLGMADLILVMEAGQGEALRYEFPFAAKSIYTISEVVDQIAYDIGDPDRKGVDPEEVGPALCEMVKRGSDKILELARKLQRERKPGEN